MGQGDVGSTYAAKGEQDRVVRQPTGSETTARGSRVFMSRVARLPSDAGSCWRLLCRTSNALSRCSRPTASGNLRRPHDANDSDCSCVRPPTASGSSASLQ
jgi:hypothetical protein